MLVADRNQVSDEAADAEAWDFYVKWLAGVIWLATAGASNKRVSAKHQGCEMA